MIDAWIIFRSSQKTFAEALKQAWRIFKIAVKMQKQIVHFKFKKLDGTIRKASGTLQNDFLPTTKGSNTAKNENIFTYFDTENNSWRSFRKENIILS